jgi:DNA-binding beta-propeller fold protein YncE
MARLLRSPVTCVAVALLLVAFMCTTVSAAMVNLGRVTHFLGNGAVKGKRDGTGNGENGALFNGPNACTLDPKEDLYIADTINYVIRKVKAGSSTTKVFAGAFGENGDVEAQEGTDARFAAPEGLAFLKDGSLGFIADAGNHRIYTLNPVTTAIGYFAGDGRPGYDEGTSEACLLNGPNGIAITYDTNDLFVTERFSHRVRKLGLSAFCSTFAGSGNGQKGDQDGTGGDARLDGPTGIAIIQKDSDIFISDTANKKIKRISKTGVVKTLAGSGQSGPRDGPGAQAQFTVPRGIAVDRKEGYIYVVDAGNNAVRRVDTISSYVDTVVGNLQSGWTSALSSIRAKLSGPRGLCTVIGRFQSRLYITGDHSVSYLDQHYTNTITEEFDIKDLIGADSSEGNKPPGGDGSSSSSELDGSSSAVATAGAVTAAAGAVAAFYLA